MCYFKLLNFITMKKSLQIVAVRPILNIDKPIIVLEVLGHEAIVRNPKQMLTDLQNSGRALDIHPKAFHNGYENADGITKGAFISACHEIQGATLTADVKAFKAGDIYELTEGHPLVVSGQAKVGDKQKAEKDGVWVEGFMQIPLTADERLDNKIANKFAEAMLRLRGFGAPQTQEPVANNPIIDDFDDDATEASNEAVGAGATKGKK